MRSRFGFARTVQFTSKLFITVAAAATLAACSDSLERFAGYGSNNPSDADPVYTASVPKAKKLAPAVESDDVISASPIASAPLKTKKPIFDYAPSIKSAKNKPKLQLDQQSVSAPVDDVATDVATLEPEQEAPVLRKPKAGLKGATVRVQPGMTLYSIARANNVSFRTLAKANRIPAPYNLTVGKLIRIPGVATASSPEVAEAQPLPVKRKGGSYTVASGDTLYSIGRKHGVSPFIIADANGLKKNSTLAIGQSLKIPGVRAAAVAKSGSRISSEPETTDQVASAQSDTGETTVKPETKTLKLPAVEFKPVAKLDAPAVKQDAPAVAAGALAMRWPANGKVISDFGSKPNGMKNEGINISMPEGTAVRAAESGVVAYAGNELKGYGNLVLIRHEGGFVTAYAHAKELSVKRGDTVKRGDVIARAGQTGAVTTPQLHFEVRKGATALDPLKFLGKATASN